MSREFLAHPADPGPAHTRLTCSTTRPLVSPPEHSNLSCQQIILASGTNIDESTQEGRFLNPPEGVERAHAVASESAISDHVTAPELPEPDDATQATQSQLFAFLTHFCSSSSPQASHFPHLLLWTKSTPSRNPVPTPTSPTRTAPKPSYSQVATRCPPGEWIEQHGPTGISMVRSTSQPRSSRSAIARVRSATR